MSTQPNSPTLLQQFPTPKPNASQVVGCNIRAEMGRQQINRTQLAEILGWTAYKLRTRLNGDLLTVGDTAELSLALDLDWGKMFAGWNSATMRSEVTA
jgi:hypothetical protein